MNLFYCENIEPGLCTFSKEESHHIVRVLRINRGDMVLITDGRGNMARGTIISTGPTACTAEIEEMWEAVEERGYRLHITISPLRNSERLDWFVEKATEIGIDIVTPVISEYTSRSGVNTERLRRLALSAMKQSLKANLPVINEPVRFTDFITSGLEGTKMIAWCGESARSNISSAYRKGSHAIIMIGPEGDFSPGEIALAEKHGFIPVTLGRSRLRTETAAVAACHSVYFMNL